MLLHPDRYYPTTTLVKYGVVVHDSESGDGSSANLINILKTPGTEPSSHGGFYGPGYHAVTNGSGGYVEMADKTAGPYSAPPLNPTWWHVCMPGYASQTRAQWMDELSMAHIRGVAQFIVDKWNQDGKSWPLSFIFADLLKLGRKGYTSHYQVSLAFGKTNHYDPGPNFPWDILEQEITNRLQAAPEDEIMYLAYLSDGSVVIVGSAVRPVSSDEIVAGGPLAKVPHFTPNPDSNWHAWLRAGLDEYLSRVSV